jgi:hypothetical protein
VNTTIAFARVEEVAKFAAGLDIDYLVCRDWSHSWNPGSMSAVTNNGRYFQSVECDNCGTVRTRIIDTQGKIVANRYTYPEGYQATDMGRIGRDGLGVIRIESMRRMTRGA